MAWRWTLSTASLPIPRDRSHGTACTPRGAVSDPCAIVPPMQSEQTRQWKREQRRLRREQKRRGLPEPPVRDDSAVPSSRILEIVG